MFMCVSTRTTKERNEKTGKSELVVSHACHVEYNVDQQLKFMKAGDERLKDFRIFHMGVDEKGVPKIGTEVKP